MGEDEEVDEDGVNEGGGVQELARGRHVGEKDQDLAEPRVPSGSSG